MAFPDFITPIMKQAWSNYNTRIKLLLKCRKNILKIAYLALLMPTLHVMAQDDSTHAAGYGISDLASNPVIESSRVEIKTNGGFWEEDGAKSCYIPRRGIAGAFGQYVRVPSGRQFMGGYCGDVRYLCVDGRATQIGQDGANQCHGGA